MYNLLRGRLVLVRVGLFLAVAALVAIGTATVYAVGNPAEPGTAYAAGELAGLWKKQLVFALAGIAGLCAVNLIHYRRLGAAGYWLYAIVLVLLCVVLLDKWVDLPFVPVINNARRWLRVPLAGRYLQIQPSELCKLVYVLALAWYLRYRSNYSSFKALIGPFCLTLLPMFLILAEPDLGTALLMMPVLFVMLLVAGAKIKHLAIIILMALVVSPFFWYRMQPYQRTRISSVLLQNNWMRRKTEQSPALGRLLVGTRFSEKQWKNDWGYHLIRAKYAVASGRMTGYGYRHGPFVKYNFLPERHNDFIFAAVAHQWGLVGCLAVLGLYILVFIFGLEIAEYTTEPFGRLLAVGIIAMFSVEVLVNVGMTIGLMPITGLTLPFVSYGGSSLLVSLMAVGLLNNIGLRRPFSVARKPFS